MSRTIGYGKIRYISFYADAPSSARYILRQLEGGEYIFEEYFEDTSLTLREFEIDTREELKEALIECRKIIAPSKATIWVEKHPLD